MSIGGKISSGVSLHHSGGQNKTFSTTVTSRAATTGVGQHGQTLLRNIGPAVAAGEISTSMQRHELTAIGADNTGE